VKGARLISMDNIIESAPMTEALVEPILEKRPARDDPVDGGYGWINVACMQLMTGQTWGINGVSI
jgi:hypothetical protein